MSSQLHLVGDQLVNFDGWTRYIDIRVFAWLRQWLTDDEAHALVFSMTRERLTRFVMQYHRDIVAMRWWPDEES